MKISLLSTRRSHGHVLAMVLVVVTICAIALMSYLKLVNAQNRVVARSQGWNAAVPVMEAGVEEALAHLNANVDAGLACDGWVRIGDYYRMERSVGENYYVVTINFTNGIFPVIESRGFCRQPLLVQHNTSPFFVAVAGTQEYGSPRENYMGRGVRITTKRNGTMNKGMLSRDEITIGGNVLVDSYDSCDSTKSTGGRYDPAKSGEGGDIASNGQLIKEITATGSVKIKGHISTGPGGTIGMNGGASIGSDDWVDAGRTGVQPGWFRDDMNVNIPDVPAPPSGGFSLPSGGTSGSTFFDWIMPNGSYVHNGNLSMNNKKMRITGDVILYVTGDFDMTGNAVIEIAPTGKLQLFVGGANGKIAGNGIVNLTGDANRMIYYGTTSNTKVYLGGTSEYIGTLYAPSAELTVPSGMVIQGATVSKSVKATGGFILHYDQCLGNAGRARYIVTGWDELTPPEVARVP